MCSIMLPSVSRRFGLVLPSKLAHMSVCFMQQKAHKSPDFPPSLATSTSMKTITADDMFNSPDPSQYCKDLGVDSTVSILKNWITKLDINQHFPRLPEAGNLAALVPQ